ncbi:hypothetical protein RFI_14286, partial [Reticulomyxa filosa]
DDIPKITPLPFQKQRSVEEAEKLLYLSRPSQPIRGVDKIEMSEAEEQNRLALPQNMKADETFDYLYALELELHPHEYVYNDDIPKINPLPFQKGRSVTEAESLLSLSRPTKLIRNVENVDISESAIQKYLVNPLAMPADILEEDTQVLSLEYHPTEVCKKKKKKKERNK